MLEAIVDLRRDNKTGKIGGKATAEKQVGDIICVKKSPAIWSKKEKERFLIVLLKDDAIEAEMGKRSLQVHPYAVVEEVETPFGPENDVINRSRYKVDHAAFKDTDALNPAKETSAVKPLGKDSLELADMTLDEKARL